jgi:hypothetical protein
VLATAQAAATMPRAHWHMTAHDRGICTDNCTARGGSSSPGGVVRRNRGPNHGSRRVCVDHGVA